MKVVRIYESGEDKRLNRPQFRLVDGHTNDFVSYWINMRPVPRTIKARVR